MSHQWHIEIVMRAIAGTNTGISGPTIIAWLRVLFIFLTLVKIGEVVPFKIFRGQSVGSGFQLD